jgi:hypothetical protein
MSSSALVVIVLGVTLFLLDPHQVRLYAGGTLAVFLLLLVQLGAHPTWY